MKTTSNGRRPKNNQSGISHQPLVESSYYFKLKHMGPNQNKIWLEMKTTSDGRQPKNIKSKISHEPMVGSYSNLNLSLDNQTILYKS